MKRIDSRLLPPGSRVLCAVSGGADSVCLLHLLMSQREELGLSLFAAHFEHGLRGEESLRDADFVRQLCDSWGIPCRVEHGNAAEAAQAKGLGIEEAARELRYDFLERTAAELGCDRIATAHNAGDQAETMLLNLTRGAGTAGLRGIPRQRGAIVRPILDWTRGEIEAYLREHGLPHVEDSSNRDPLFSRNRLRLEVLPVLRELNPRFDEAALRTASLLEQDEDCLSGLAEAFIREQLRDGALPQKAFADLHPAVASRVLRLLCPRSLSRGRVLDLLALSRGTERKTVDVPGLRVRREQGRIFFREEESFSLPERELEPGKTVDIPELGLRLTAEETVFRREIHDLFKTYCFKSNSVCGKIYCTGRRDGDRIHPLGRGCGKKLKALLLEAGMTQAQRDRVLVLRDERGPLAIIGMAVDERTRPSDGDRIIQVKIEKL